ncbi:kinetochore-associated protein NSL1 homolog isoform X1 [Falco naumanni]|uniref:kinetochore-associated protein NSL1 homolog isoform X1 n=1 Tax=Falco naumanni TaxID=148594 RepID=UPI001ADE8B1C|nr:kinetochore-associated protein NSL1 homolog isoform X1 [Falco naumanni]
MAASPVPPPSPAAARDPRVQCCSRRGLGEVMALCAPFVRALAQGQPGGDAAVGDALGSFETAVRENVTINGQPWEVTLDDSLLQSGSNIKILEDQFDELIVETAAKRKQWPKKILVHAVQTMKAEQEMLKLYQPVVTPEKIRSQPSQDAYIADLKQVTETASEQISGTMKSHEEDDRKVRRREKNRVAAQRSRKKQTQKADKLHEEYETLEQENTSLKREIGKLTDEMKHLSEVLKDHEKICPLLHCTMNFVTVPRPDALTSCLPR